ncbi:MAG: hypothetical protein ACREFF_03830 [Candidatus Udaeobacter sp.]
MKTRMKAIARVLMLVPILLGGCQATHDVAATSYHVTRGAAVGSYKVARAVAVESYRVASAPVHYATRKSSGGPTMVGTTEATSSDVTQPGQPMPPQTAAERPQSRTSSEVPRTTRNETAQSSTKAGSSRPSASQENFPTGKSVPGKPGYVFSPFDREGRYVDVSGYAPGTKVKDPWTDKIFLVP